MEVHLSPDQEAQLKQTAASLGRNAEHLIAEAVERFLADEACEMEVLRAAVSEADDDIANGRYTDYTDESLQLLLEQLKQEGRSLRHTRLARPVDG